MTNTIPNDTRELEIGELDSVSGGSINGALEGVCRNDKPQSQGDAIKAFQQLLQEI
jgi:hypothetical protein